MGHVANTVRTVTTGVAKNGLGAGRAGCAVPSGIRKFTDNATQNLKHGSKSTPIVNECRNVTEGIAKGDFVKAGVNAGIVGATAKLAGVAQETVKAGTSKLTANYIAGMSMGMIPFENAKTRLTHNYIAGMSMGMIPFEKNAEHVG